MSQKHNSKKTLLSHDEKLWKRISSKFGKDEDKWLRFIWDEARSKAKDKGFSLPEFDKFWKNGFQEVLSPRKQTILLEKFRIDPEKNPISTPSGKTDRSKFESEEMIIVCKGLSRKEKLPIEVTL